MSSTLMLPSKDKSEVPKGPIAELPYHFVSFVQAGDGHVYKMDADKKDSLDCGNSFAQDENFQREREIQ